MKRAHLVLILALCGAALVSSRSALAQPYPAQVPAHWHAPGWFLRDALCLHSHEGALNDNTGNSYFGGWQFLESTWLKVGGPYEAAFDHPGDPRYPFTASPREQLFRVWLVYERDGNFSEWGTAGMCGL